MTPASEARPPSLAARVASPPGTEAALLPQGSGTDGRKGELAIHVAGLCEEAPFLNGPLVVSRYGLCRPACLAGGEGECWWRPLHGVMYVSHE
jgi:hypothetical protein